jgi:hypothetical protein
MVDPDWERNWTLVQRNNQIINAVLGLIRQRTQQAMDRGMERVYCPICDAARIDYNIMSEALRRRDKFRRNREVAMQDAVALAIEDLKNDRVGSAISRLTTAFEFDGTESCREEAP